MTQACNLFFLGGEEGRKGGKKDGREEGRDEGRKEGRKWGGREGGERERERERGSEKGGMQQTAADFICRLEKVVNIPSMRWKTRGTYCRRQMARMKMPDRMNSFEEPDTLILGLTDWLGQV